MTDADLAAFENDVRWGIYFNAGQVLFGHVAGDCPRQHSR